MRISHAMRELTRETRLSVKDLICPVFVQENLDARISVNSMPGMERLPLGELSGEIETIASLGIPAIMLFGIPAAKDDLGTRAFAENGIVQRAISDIRDNFGDKIVIMADACLCHYTSSGHCGIMSGDIIDNDRSLKTLARIATSQASSGADVISPSAMMDGQVAAIRSALDDEGFSNVSIMPHAAKHRSPLYSPFRDAAHCAPKFGDRKTYQSPFTNRRESLREIMSDIEEGADIIMVKPALPYIDIISEARRRLDAPIAAYNVSGEYALVKGAAHMGWIDEDAVVDEMLHSIKRAGADMIVTYFAKQAAVFLNNEG